MVAEQRGAGAWAVNVVLRALLTAPRVLPYRWRIPLVGWLTSRVIAPLGGFNRRIHDNLSLIFPQMDPAEAARITRAVTDNAGRVLAEIYSGEEFVRHVQNSPVSGPGYEVAAAAHRAGRAVITVSAHFGNYDTLRAVFTRQGFPIAPLYRPLANVYFNRHYVQAMETIATPIFPQTRRGLGDMVRFLRGGGMLALLTDQRDGGGAELSFFGHPALTALSAAELALKYDAMLVPAYAIRKENGLDFEIVVDEPIPHTDPATMMQAVNDGLEAHVRAHMGQWLWLHRRWSAPKRRRGRLA